MEPGIEVHRLVVELAGRRILDGVDLSVSKGRIAAMLGPNGAGKTTTINVLTGLLRPISGSVRVAGVDVVRRPGDVRSRISVTGQSAALDELLTGAENLRMMGRLWGLSTKDARHRANELLNQVDLEDAAGRRVRDYSGGMRRRLDLAASLIRRPEVLFLDEPTTGLDARSRRAVWEHVRALSGSGTTVLLTTQYLEEADELADEVVVLDGGRVVAAGPPAELKSRTGGEMVEVCDPAGSILERVPTDGTVRGLRVALETLESAGVRGEVMLRRPTLDDVVLALTGTPGRNGEDR